MSRFSGMKLPEILTATLHFEPIRADIWRRLPKGGNKRRRALRLYDRAVRMEPLGTDDIDRAMVDIERAGILATYLEAFFCPQAVG